MRDRPSLRQRITTLEPAPPWTLVTAFLTMLGAFIAVLGVSAFVATWLGSRPLAPVIAWVFGGLAIIAFVLQTRQRDRDALRLQAPRSSLPLLLVLNIAFAMALDLVSLAATGQFVPVPELVPLATQSTDAFAWGIAALFMLVVQPIAEELVFRGVAFPSFRVALGAWGGVIASAVAYGIFHLLVYPPAYGNAPAQAGLWYALILPMLHGLVFALNRAATGSTRAAMIAHAGVGLFALLKVFALAR